MVKKVATALVFMLVLLIAQAGWGADQSKEAQVFAVQNKIFHRSHELAVNIGYIADDEFYMVYPLSLGYTYNFSENYGWEVARLQYLITQERELMQKLKEDYSVQPELFSQPKYMLHSHLVWKPLYGKSALMNRKVINHETYLFVGGGITHYEKTYSNGMTESEDAMSFSAGGGFKYFLNQKFCLNVELRDILNFRKDENENNLAFAVGLGWRFNLAPRKVEEDPTIKKLDKILSE